MSSKRGLRDVVGDVGEERPLDRPGLDAQAAPAGLARFADDREVTGGQKERRIQHGRVEHRAVTVLGRALIRQRAGLGVERPPRRADHYQLTVDGPAALERAVLLAPVIGPAERHAQEVLPLLRVRLVAARRVGRDPAGARAAPLVPAPGGLEHAGWVLPHAQLGTHCLEAAVRAVQQREQLALIWEAGYDDASRWKSYVPGGVQTISSLRPSGSSKKTAQ